MKKSKKYLNASSFRQALADHLRQISKKEALDISRLRNQVGFDRFLFRLFRNDPSPWLLKGGYSIELRLKSSVATKDVDLALRENMILSKNPNEKNEALHEKLQTCISDDDVGDFFNFTIGSAAMSLEGPPQKGTRFPIEAQLDGKTFSKFKVDISVGDINLQPIDMLSPKNYLSFAGIQSIKYPAISTEQQFAEKLHAYTRSRKTGYNSRVKDLIDMVLLIQLGSMDSMKIASAIKTIFDHYQSHPIPEQLSEPPETWKDPFQIMADECRFSGDITHAFKLLSEFFENLPL